MVVHDARYSNYRKCYIYIRILIIVIMKPLCALYVILKKDDHSGSEFHTRCLGDNS